MGVQLCALVGTKLRLFLIINTTAWTTARGVFVSPAFNADAYI